MTENRKKHIFTAVLAAILVTALAAGIYSIVKNRAPGSSTVRCGQTEETLFKGEENYAQLEKFKEDKLSTGGIFNNWAVKKDAESSGLGFATGFLDEYSGYHSVTARPAS